MKLCRFSLDGAPHLGRIDGEQVTDLSGLGFAGSMRALLAALGDRRDAIAAATGPTHALADVVLEAPIADPQKFLAIQG